MAAPTVAAGAVAIGGTSVSGVVVPAGGAGSLVLLLVDTAESTNVQPPTPSGYTLLGTAAQTSGTFGVDAGPRRTTAFYRVAANAESQSTLLVSHAGSGSTRAISSQALRVSSANSGNTWDLAITPGTDTSSGTGYSVTGAANLGLTTEDLLVYSTVLSADTASPSNPSGAASGATLSGTITQHGNTANSNGNDLRTVNYSRAVTAGTSTGAPTWAMSLSAAATGATNFIRVRQPAPLPVGTGTLEVAMAPVETPPARTGHSLSFLATRTDTGVGGTTLTATVLDGSTTIATRSWTDALSGPEDSFMVSLTQAEAGAISAGGYAAGLRLRVRVDSTASGDSLDVHVRVARLRVPGVPPLAPPADLTAVVEPDGDVALTWTPSPDPRTVRHVIRRASGTTAPASPTDGVAVADLPVTP
jgi:hypothetical protein